MNQNTILKGKALKRAMECKDAIRITGNIPLITDTTELITPDIAREMLEKNKHNRPINWKKVEEYAKIMAAGLWTLHSQGIILDAHGNILTGQKRLWAVIYSGVSVLFRISRGCPANTAHLLDRGTPQTGRDLATRSTERKHSPVESSMARAIAFLRGHKSLNPDILADIMVKKEKAFSSILEITKGTKKTKAVLMVLAALNFITDDPEILAAMAAKVNIISDELTRELRPTSAEACWGKGVAFVMALEQARKCVERNIANRGKAT